MLIEVAGYILKSTGLYSGWIISQSIVQKQPKSFSRQRNGTFFDVLNLNPIEHAYSEDKTEGRKSQTCTNLRWLH